MSLHVKMGWVLPLIKVLLIKINRTIIIVMAVTVIIGEIKRGHKKNN